jgi:hypothetical protein
MTTATYAVIWFTRDGQQQRGGFGSYDAAQSWAADTVDPGVCGSTIPNIPTEFYAVAADGVETYAGHEYVGGLYFARVNRFAAVVKETLSRSEVEARRHTALIRSAIADRDSRR